VRQARPPINPGCGSSARRWRATLESARHVRPRLGRAPHAQVTVLAVVRADRSAGRALQAQGWELLLRSGDGRRLPPKTVFTVLCVGFAPRLRPMEGTPKTCLAGGLCQSGREGLNLRPHGPEATYEYPLILVESQGTTEFTSHTYLLQAFARLCRMTRGFVVPPVSK
jgi:hypothetical protein